MEEILQLSPRVPHKAASADIDYDKKLLEVTRFQVFKHTIYSSWVIVRLRSFRASVKPRRYELEETKEARRTRFDEISLISNGS